MVKISRLKPAILKRLQSCVKTVARVQVLVAALLLSSAVTPAADITQTKKSINERVQLVRETVKRRTTNAQLQSNDSSYSERTLTQWGNWGNWGNWNNWVNWNNWNNWRNWGNWGNWGNF